ncbi:MAG TPA: GyrI-like domain-containing protein [Vicinamibacterales bacterium]|jgi:effector-binding domain-containing protein
MPDTPVRLEQIPAVPVAVIRRRVQQAELSRVVPECCGLVWNVVRRQGAKGGRHIAIHWDGTIRLEVGVELEGPFTEQDEVVRSATPGGLVAWATHFGPYGGRSAAHDAVRQWCGANNYALAGPNWEIYGHWQPEWDSDPSQIRTDVYYQVAEANDRPGKPSGG